MKIAILEDIYQKAIEFMKKEEFVTLDDLLSLSRHMQSNEMDVHIIIAGQNGLGKTILELALMSMWYETEEEILNNLITAENTTSDLITYILGNEGKLCGIDEMNIFLDYKQHSDLMQRHLITSFELARSKRIVFLGCVRDPRKLSLNYRNGKMSIVVWMLDRYEEGGAYGAVFIAPASVEAEDRFGFDAIPQFTGDFDSLRFYMENLPSFSGWLKVEHKDKLVKQSLLDKYKEVKNTAMAYSHVNKLVDLFCKGRVSETEYDNNINQLKEMLGEANVNQVLDKRGKLSKQTKLSI